MARELHQRGFLDISIEEKPDGLEVLEMFDSKIIISGSVPLASKSHELNVDSITQEHIYLAVQVVQGRSCILHVILTQ
jgi:hypothetical protein